MDQNPATRVTVDLLILDYMVCLCVSGILETIQNGPNEDIEWFAISVERKH
jgi:hypothetical protein